jgi:ribosome biogenesis GTPase
MDIETNELAGLFYEFGSIGRKCQFSPCFHDHEPGCALKKKVEQGKISPDRYQSYLNILYSLQEQYARMYR